MSEGQSSGTQVYQAGAGRKAILTLMFIMLLPFFISMPVMVFMRARAGLYTDAISLAIVAVIYGACLAFLLAHLIYSHRTKLSLGEKSVKVSVPHWRGPTPSLIKYVDKDVPYADIQSVESRGEIYKEIAVPMLMRSSSLVTKDGERLMLGYVIEDSVDAAFPFHKIAEDIAGRAGVKVTDLGAVKAGGQYRALFKGAPPWEAEAVSDDTFLELKMRNHRVMGWIVIALLGLITLALVVDLSKFLNLNKIVGSGG